MRSNPRYICSAATFVARLQPEKSGTRRNFRRTAKRPSASELFQRADDERRRPADQNEADQRFHRTEQAPRFREIRGEAERGVGGGGEEQRILELSEGPDGDVEAG